MPILEAVNNKYYTHDDLWNLINYATKDEHCTENVYGAQGTTKSETEIMYQQMLYVKKYFHKEEGRQALHYILSFSNDEEEYIGIQEALEIGYKIADCFRGWQVVFGVHTNTEHLHIHFVVNNTSYENGKSFSMGVQGLNQIQAIAKNIVLNYRLKSLPKEERGRCFLESLGI